MCYIHQYDEQWEDAACIGQKFLLGVKIKAFASSEIIMFQSSVAVAMSTAEKRTAEGDKEEVYYILWYFGHSI